jgi:hypothetical protein
MTIAHIPPTYIKASVFVYTGHWITKKVDIHTYIHTPSKIRNGDSCVRPVPNMRLHSKATVTVGYITGIIIIIIIIYNHLYHI